MIPVTRVPEPADFDKQARQPGKAWLAKNPHAERPHDYWSPFRADLASGFSLLCGYSAMRIADEGTVDHYESFKMAPNLAYEWKNYRFAAQWLNSSKKSHLDVLDPYEVGPDWFEIQLPSLQLIATKNIPQAYQGIVSRMMAKFPIGHDERIIRQRRAWYKLYEDGGLTFAGLKTVAPLIAAAEDKRLAQIHGILKALAANNIVVDSAAQAKIKKCKDHAKLDRWLLRAATATSVDDVITAT